MIRMAGETVTRTIAELKKRQLLAEKGANSPYPKQSRS
jgi:hypothetical protein